MKNCSFIPKTISDWLVNFTYGLSAFVFYKGTKPIENIEVNRAKLQSLLDQMDKVTTEFVLPSPNSLNLARIYCRKVESLFWALHREFELEGVESDNWANVGAFLNTLSTYLYWANLLSCGIIKQWNPKAVHEEMQ